MTFLCSPWPGWNCQVDEGIIPFGEKLHVSLDEYCNKTCYCERHQRNGWGTRARCDIDCDFPPLPPLGEGEEGEEGEEGGWEGAEGEGDEDEDWEDEEGPEGEGEDEDEDWEEEEGPEGEGEDEDEDWEDEEGDDLEERDAIREPLSMTYRRYEQLNPVWDP